MTPNLLPMLDMAGKAISVDGVAQDDQRPPSAHRAGRSGERRRRFPKSVGKK